MGVVNTTYTFTGTDTITSSKLNNIIDDTTFTGSAVSGGTLQVTAGGQLAVSGGGITSNELATNSVVTDKITNLNVTTAKIADSAITSAKIADGTIVNADINASAAIAGTKVSPNFGSQNVVTTGNVAGGTSTASAPIHGQRASGSAGWAVLAKTTGVSNDSGIYFDASNNSFIEGRNGSGTLVTSIKSSGESFINGGGLGIGTNNPDTTLDVRGSTQVKMDSNNGTTLTLNNEGVFGGKSFVFISTGSSNGSGVGHLEVYAPSGGDVNFVTSGNVGVGTQSPTEKLDVSGTIKTTKLTSTGDVTAIGSVGAGTASPSAKLHVLSGSNPAKFESNTADNYVQLLTSEGNNNRVEICNRTGGRLALYTVGGGDSLNILKTGEVGIGKTNPSTALDVSGTVTATAFSGPLTGNVTGSASTVSDGAITAAKLSGAQSGSAPVYGARAWVNFDGTTSPPQIRSSGNVSSVTKSAAGNYVVTLGTDFGHTNYAVMATIGNNVNLTSTTTTDNAFIYEDGAARSGQSFRLRIKQDDNASSEDRKFVSVVVFA